MTRVHASAIVDARAELAGTVEVGPYALIGPGVRIDEGTVVGSHCTIGGPTTIGRDNVVHAHCSLGGAPQDMKYRGEPTELVIGERNTIFEFCTISRGTVQDQGVTRIGNDNWLMATVHLAHDVQMGSHIVMANYAACAGHVQVGDWAVIGGMTGVHQFCKVGTHAITGFQSHVGQDVPPFMMAAGNPLTVPGFNVEGLRRRGFSRERLANIKQMHRLLYRDGLTLMPPRRKPSARCATGSTTPTPALTRRCCLTSWPRASAASRVSGMRLAMVAGEASGDLLAGLLLSGLRERWPDLRSGGIGGPRMVGQGFDAWWPHEALAVRGYIEVLKHFRELFALRTAVTRRLLREPPDLFVGVDAPDINLGLERRLKRAGVKTVHFVCPSIWAWRAGRAKKMAASADHVLCLFPFEPELLHAHGVAATYVGHPLASLIPLQPPRAAGRAALGLSEHDAVVAVLPGSRASEVSAIAPTFLETAALLQRQRPELRFVLPVMPGLRPMIEPLVARHAPGVTLQLLDGQSHEALAACDVTLIASGTATLEAALFKRPMVIGYKMHALTYQIMRHMGLVPWVGLPNILCREFVVPERLQADCVPPTLASDVLRLLDDTAGAERLSQRFDELHHLLRRDTAHLASDAIAQVLQA